MDLRLRVIRLIWRSTRSLQGKPQRSPQPALSERPLQLRPRCSELRHRVLIYDGPPTSERQGHPYLISIATSPPDSSTSAEGNSFQGAATWQTCAVETLTVIDSSQQYPLLLRRGRNVASSAACHLQRAAFPSQSQSHAPSGTSGSRFPPNTLPVRFGSSASRPRSCGDASGHPVS